ncbi:MAG: twin-arginine translocation signal domain-containing protein [Nitrospirae bacterium]|nr:twin-arginine translocation signal domain-containing protein [Nitrospirota bacterium]
MERRDFLKGAAAAAVVFNAGNALAHEYGKEAKPAAEQDKINKVVDKENPTALEQKHVPSIQAPSKVKADQWVDIEVKVGFKAEHPSTADHWITTIKLLADGKEVARIENAMGGLTSSSALFTIKLSKSVTLEAVEHCNLHGTWMSEPEKIEVA